jgi:hypothetical protein
MSPNVQPPQRYEIRPVSKLGDWAIVVIDVSRGYFSAVSSRGNYAHQWPETGFDFVRLLLEMERDWDYLHGKLMSGRPNAKVYDGDATRAAVKEAIADLDDELLRAMELSLIEEHDELSDPLNFSMWLGETQLYDALECRRTVLEPDCVVFCKEIYPRFVALLRADGVAT